jgi:hypothetical protein
MSFEYIYISSIQTELKKVFERIGWWLAAQPKELSTTE